MNQVGNTQINTAAQGSNNNFQGIALSLMKNASSFMQLLESSLAKSIEPESSSMSREYDFSTRGKSNDDSFTCMEHRQEKEITEEKYSPESAKSRESSENTNRQSHQNNPENTGARESNTPVTNSSVELQPIPLANSLNLINTLNGLTGNKIQIAKAGNNSVDITASSVKKQVFSKVLGSNLLLSGKGSFKLSLTPPQLGRVEALFQKDGTKLSITLKVESVAAGQALKEGSAELGDIILNKSQEWEDVEINIEVEEEETFQENDQSDFQDNQAEQDDEDNQGVE
ncbi:MAG: flagellar hook-length control protein FliK [bacterium]|nr:flagellar hook-length control protein FliK [bacterium]MCP4799179.1 flagellar hook-length control protein FliK [bacterium]